MTVLLKEPEALDAETIQEDEKTAKAEAERTRPGLTMFTDGSRLDSGATGYAVVWQNGQSWAGVRAGQSPLKGTQPASVTGSIATQRSS